MPNRNAPPENSENLKESMNPAKSLESLKKLLPVKLEAMTALKPASERAKEEYDVAQEAIEKRNRLLQPLAIA
jgi:hypothetical protein